MNHSIFRPVLCGLLACGTLAVQADTACCPTGDKFAAPAGGETIVLTGLQMRNLGLETAETVEGKFEKTLFALGRIEAIPNKQSAVSSRIPGRVVSLAVNPGESVRAGQELLKIESRQAGDPPPVITFRAAIDGTVCELDVRPGDPVEPDRRMMDVTDLREVMAVARVFEHQSGRLETGMTARIRVPAFPDQTFAGELIRLGTSVNADSGTIDAVFRIGNEDLKLKPGMRAEFSILVAEKPGVMLIPREALLGDAGNQFVYVADYEKPGVFSRAAVGVAEMNDQLAEISSGLFPGDKVVTRGNFALQFAGGGKASLKEAMDAAHGHSHGPDGEELEDSGDAHGHAHGDETGKAAPPEVRSGPPIVPLGLTALAAFAAGLFLGRKKRHA
ncbi:MAG TPA: efflux RND transporter periplasmic adaptor subunit [Terrimicrobiaceae bacterium]|nr:efflux RND transporter periplasmic adaptor subunit [Terrimicrobiaceae bacterium]